MSGDDKEYSVFFFIFNHTIYTRTRLGLCGRIGKLSIQNLVADWVATGVGEFTPAWLKKHGFAGVLADLDNTLAGYGAAEPCPEIRRWAGALRDAGIPLVIVSNNNAARVSRFCAPLGILFVAKAGKPKPEGLLKALALTGLPSQKVLMVGDQVFTDVRAAGRAGLRVALVEPYTRGFWVRVRRVAESPFITVARRRQNRRDGHPIPLRPS